MGSIRIRAGLTEDAEAVARMGNALNRELGIEGQAHTADGIVRDGFGANPRFSLLIAEVDGTAAGYAMYHPAYDSDIAAASVWLVDLYVEGSARRLGVGRELMRAMARETLRAGAKTLEWCVLEQNERAIAFYRALGAKGGSLRVLEMRGDALSALADGSEDSKTRS
jgi:GNAT superfamily N-acetyltransferase